jgi:ApaG protein
MTALPFFYRLTNGIRITVRPLYLRAQSDPAAQHYVFAYFIRIENVGTQTAQLLSRRWLIHDEIGEDTEVVGDGVVGEQPVIAPGHVHEYQSFCVLKSGEGFMEGKYYFERNNGETFEAEIPRFILSATESSDLQQP